MQASQEDLRDSELPIKSLNTARNKHHFIGKVVIENGLPQRGRPQLFYASFLQRMDSKQDHVFAINVNIKRDY